MPGAKRTTTRTTRGTGRRLVGAVAGLLAIGLLAACTGGSDSSNASKTEPSGSHAGHSGSFSPPPAAPLRAGERFTTITMPEPYTPKAPNGGTDEYRCFLVDPGLTSAAYLTGSQFLPQNAAIVHHAIFFQVGPADVAKARAVDEANPGEGWTCFGGADIGADAAWVAHWAPGANETLLSQDIGYPLAAGSMMVMQVHYNLLATDGKAGGSDRSGIRLRLADGAKALIPLQTGLLPGPIELPCTPEESGPLCDRAAAVSDVAKRFGPEVGGAEANLIQACSQGVVNPGPTQRCDHPMRQAGTVYAVGGHMHLLGRSIKIELNPGAPGARTLLDITNYDFDRQSVDPLASPVAIKQGDVLRVTCTHDAGLRRQLPALKNIAPRYVVWGDGTSDEMCLGLMVWSAQA